MTTVASPIRAAFAVLPADPEAEACVIGAMILNEGCIPTVRASLSAEDFFNRLLRTIFVAICRLADDGSPVELPTLRPLLTRREPFDLAGGLEYIINGPMATPSSASFAHYVKAVKEAATRRRLVALADRLRDEALSGAAPADDLLAGLEARLDELRSPTAPPCHALAAPMTAGELLQSYPHQREPIIHGLLRRGEVGNLISGPKMHKSWLMLHLGLCVATGRAALGFATRPGRVLLLDLELTAETLAGRLGAVMAAMGLGSDELGDRLSVDTMRGRPLDARRLQRRLAAHGPGRFDLVILDPLYRVFGEEMDENSNAHFASLFGHLQAAAERMNAAILTVHHLTKGDQSFKALTDLGAGSGSQARAADAHLALRPHAQEGAAVMAGVVRSFPPFEPFAIQWQYPLWQVARDLDPTELRRSPRAAARPTEPRPPKPVKVDYDVPGFVEAFLTSEPVARPAILAAAQERGLSERRSARLLASAEARMLAFRWKVGSERHTYYASRPQPLLTGEGDRAA